MNYQRLTVTTISEESADMLFRVMSDNGTVVNKVCADDTGWTLVAIVPIELGNGPLFNVQNMVARYIGEVTEYRSEWHGLKGY